MCLRDQDQSERQPGEDSFGDPEGTPSTKISANHRSHPRLDLHAHTCVQIFIIGHLKLSFQLHWLIDTGGHIDLQHLHMSLSAMTCLQNLNFIGEPLAAPVYRQFLKSRSAQTG